MVDVEVTSPRNVVEQSRVGWMVSRYNSRRDKSSAVVEWWTIV